MKALTFTITTEQPLLMTSFQGDPNSDISYSYIPGSAIRGALIGRYLRSQNLKELDLADSTVHQLFFDAAHTRYLNAYIIDRKGNRTLPVPWSWLREKEDELTRTKTCKVYDFALALPPKLTSPKTLGDHRFWAKDGSKIRLYQPERRMNIHTQRDRTKGRATKTGGEIFRYEAIEAGQTFQSVIICDGAEAEHLQKLLDLSPSLWLGGSRSAGYGKATLDPNKRYGPWQETAGQLAKTSVQTDAAGAQQTSAKPTGTSLVITFLSAALLRDALGQPAADASAITTTLRDYLPGLENHTPVANKTFIKRSLVGGFNRKWGLPLPQRVVIAAGSVITFDSVSVTPEQLQQLATAGIGERRIEGFGRVAINHRNQAELTVTLASASGRGWEGDTEPPTVDKIHQDIGEKIAKRILSQRLEKILIQEVGHCKLVPNALSNSQLSRLELAARDGLAQHSFEPVINLLKPENLTKTARRQFERSQLGNRSFSKQLTDWTDGSFTWITNVLNEDQQTVSLAPSLQVSLSDPKGKTLATDCTLKLMMAVAKQAKKEKSQ